VHLLKSTVFQTTADQIFGSVFSKAQAAAGLCPY